MLTPEQVKEKEFKSGGRNSYKSEDVDAFIREVGASYEQMFRQNAELVKRVSLLAERLEQYKKLEDSIKSAAINAQKAADDTVAAAKADAELIRREAADVLAAAKGEAALIEADAESDVEKRLAAQINAANTESEIILSDAKKEAERILMESESVAKDRQGAITRTITSETLMFEMLKKEVTEFKSDLIEKYRAHIELINQLPEIAANEVKEQLGATQPEKASAEPDKASAEPEVIPAEPEKASAEPEAPVYEAENEPEPEIEEEAEAVEEYSEPEFITAMSEELPVFDSSDAGSGEYVVKTEIPDFDKASAELEIVDDDEADAEEPEDISTFSPVVPAKKHGFSINISRLSNKASETAEDVPEAPAETTAFSEPEVDEAEYYEHEENEQEERAHVTEEDLNFFEDEHPDLKKRFGVIKDSDMVPAGAEEQDNETDDGNDDDDDDDDEAQSLLSFFKKKK